MARTNDELTTPSGAPVSQAARTSSGGDVADIANMGRSAATTEISSAARAAAVRDLSTVEVIKEITREVGELAKKQVELATTELKADVKAEAKMLGGMGVAALAGLTTVNLLLVTAVFALTRWMSGWAAGLAVSAATFCFAAIVALVAWGKRVRSPLHRTRRTLKEDLQWSKERLV